MNHQTSPRFLILTLGGVGGMLVAVVIGLPLLALLSAPPVVLVICAALTHRRPELTVTMDGPARAVEGDRIDLIITVRSNTRVPWLQVGIELPSDLRPIDGIRHAVVAIPAGSRAVVRFPVELTRWGVATTGRVETQARGRFGLFVSSQVHRSPLAIRVHPRDGNRKSVVVPARLRARVGDHRSRRHGEGSDFAEVRPYRRGDSLRAINWRVSLRRDERWVTVRHPDQSGDLVFLLDTFRDLGPDGNRLVQRAVRAAMSLAESNLDAHDRVGLLDVGRHIRWYRPRQGRLQKARLFDALLESQVEPGLRAPSLAQLPLHDLDAGTMVVVLTGLTDPEMSTLPIELRMHGLQVAVLECAVDDHLLPSADEAVELAVRLWRLIRLQRRRQLVSHGVPVMTWDADQPIELPVAAMARAGNRSRATSVG